MEAIPSQLGENMKAWLVSDSRDKDANLVEVKTEQKQAVRCRASRGWQGREGKSVMRSLIATAN